MLSPVNVTDGRRVVPVTIEKPVGAVTVTVLIDPLFDDTFIM